MATFSSLEYRLKRLRVKSKIDIYFTTCFRRRFGRQRQTGRSLPKKRHLRISRQRCLKSCAPWRVLKCGSAASFAPGAIIGCPSPRARRFGPHSVCLVSVLPLERCACDKNLPRTLDRCRSKFVGSHRSSEAVASIDFLLSRRRPLHFGGCLSQIA